MNNIFALFIAAASLFLSWQVSAHHSFTSEFDINRPIKLTGAVNRIEWTNPHAWFHMTVETEDGKTESWAIELLGVNALVRQGWTRDKIQPGDILYVEGYQARNGSPTGNASIVIIQETGEQVWGSTPITDE